MNETATEDEGFVFTTERADIRDAPFYMTGYNAAIRDVVEALRGKRSRYGSGLTVAQANEAADWLARELAPLPPAGTEGTT